MPPFWFSMGCMKSLDFFHGFEISALLKMVSGNKQTRFFTTLLFQKSVCYTRTIWYCNLEVEILCQQHTPGRKHYILNPF